LKNEPVAILSPREKMVLEVTPFFPNLTRVRNAAETAAEAVKLPVETTNGSETQ
jgi:hypothetical protein